jgi:hypothetical protein
MVSGREQELADAINESNQAAGILDYPLSAIRYPLRN